MAALRPITRQTLSEQVARSIIDMIQGGEYKPGQKLPKETELCHVLNVGRSTLREGLKVLSFLGMVRTRPGGGTYVADGSDFFQQAFGRGLLRSPKDIRDLFETRIVLETKLAALCAQHGKDEDFQTLDRLVNEMRDAMTNQPKRFLELDLDFHMTIAKSSGNLVMANLVKLMRSLLHEWLMKTWLVPDNCRVAYKDHSLILKAIRRRSARGARSAMLHHLENVPTPYAVLLGQVRQDAQATSVVKGLLDRKPRRLRKKNSRALAGQHRH